ncbi:hypothetical protein EW145_g3341 [Phellinidium pouzarii]|uniref:DNA ligase n=1 Tax=Phellinidium pouzarii TaxID=167371 RepID=A0A4V3XCX4_9AGAM|nr:hypothetical protein EW145_g3341 [Phellinidium pouzarii]
MPPNRSNASTPSPAKKRKIQVQPVSKVARGSLDSFFKRPSQKSETAGNETHATSTASSSKDTIQGIEDDEAVAMKLAFAEGMDVGTVRAMERNWKSSILESPSKQLPSEVIDVDAIRDAELPRATSEEMSTKVNNFAPISSSSSRAGDAFSPHKETLEAASSTVKNTFTPKTQDNVIDISSYPILAGDPLRFPFTDCPWRKTSPSPTPYSFLTHVLCSLSGTRSRIAISNILTNALRNSLAPPYIPIELGLGHATISKAIQQVSGLSSAALKRLYNKTGDAGDVAYEARSNLRTIVPHPALTVTSVYKSLLKICQIKAARGEETRYLVRTMTQHIRVGAVRASILTALARALVLTRPFSQSKPPDNSPYFVAPNLLSGVKEVTGKGKKKEDDDPVRSAVVAKFLGAERLLKQVYVQHPNYDHIAEALLDSGLEGLDQRVTLQVGIPLRPALGSPSRSLDEIYDRLGNLPFTAEFKYDGQRAQIHAVKTDGDLLVRIFSRHLEDMTDKYPDVIRLVEEMFKLHNDMISFIIDSEIVAIDPVDGGLKTFQELSNRARKDVRLEDIKISVCIFAFDLMFYNNASLLEQPFRVRRQTLRTHFPPVTFDTENLARFAHVECCGSEDGREAVEEFWQRAVDSRSEGLMIKLLDSGEMLEDVSDSKTKKQKKLLPATYEPDKRTSAWLKLKKDYVLGLGDSLDLVPIGAWHGNGRKAAWWSPILLAVWDENVGQLVGLCKCMSGFTDEFYKAGSLKLHLPQEVWEIHGADITISPISVAALGLVSQERGLSLRFPRFIRMREDKGISEASTAEYVATMWRNQESRGSESKGIDDGDLIDASPEVSEVEEDESAILTAELKSRILKREQDTGEPFALQEYYASCYANGSLSLITMPISRHTQNILHSPTHSASMTVWSSPPAASRARVALMGNVTFLTSQFAIDSGIRDCYLEHHPDAKWWLPDDPDAPHLAYWARFDPFGVYFVGGFGDKHYIGDIPLNLYQGARPSIVTTAPIRVQDS